MPTLSLNALRKEVKAGKLASVYYFHGAEETLKEEALAALVDLAVDPASRDFNYDVRHANTLDPEALHALVNTLPMMAERRVVVIRDVDAWTVKSPARKVLLEYVAKPAAETLLVLHQGPPKDEEKKDEVDKELAAHAQVVNFGELDAEEAGAWVTRRAKLLKISLTPEAVVHLVNATGPQLALLRLELEKLSALGGTEPIGVDVVGEMVGIRFGETIYDWRDAVLRRDVTQATTMLPRILGRSGVSGVSLVSLLGTSLITLGVVRAHYDRKLRARELNEATWATLKKNYPRIGNWGAFVTLTVEVAADWPQGRIRRGLAALLAADQALKETRISTEEGVLMDLVLQIAARMPAEGAA